MPELFPFPGLPEDLIQSVQQPQPALENNSTQIDRPNEESFSWMNNEPDRLLPGQLWRDGDLGGNRW